MLHTPVAFIIFNRPDKTERVFHEISKAMPKKLLVIADGPRIDHPSDVKKCAAARAIMDRVDWECEVMKHYSEVNLGCGLCPGTGISWVFEQVQEAIILEDDCVPHPTFFRFCQELLEKYRDDTRVMSVGGLNIYQSPTAYSYYFSRMPACVGGWATWRRAWQYCDMQIKLWPVLRGTSWLFDILEDARLVQYWQNIFDRAYASAGNVDYWDYQWMFACWAQSGLSILPTKSNLICNIGFGEDATHTKSVNDIRANLPVNEMIFPLRHPPYVVRDREVDQLVFKDILCGHQRYQDLYQRLYRKLFRAIPSSFRKQISSLISRTYPINS